MKIALINGGFVGFGKALPATFYLWKAIIKTRMQLMSMCRHMIVANSSFSHFAQLLN